MLTILPIILTRGYSITLLSQSSRADACWVWLQNHRVIAVPLCRWLPILCSLCSRGLCLLRQFITSLMNHIDTSIKLFKDFLFVCLRYINSLLFLCKTGILLCPTLFHVIFSLGWACRLSAGILDSVLLVWTNRWFSLFRSFCFYLSFLSFNLMNSIFCGQFCSLSSFLVFWSRGILLGEKGLEASVGVHSMRVLPYFILDSLHRGHMARFLLLWTNGSGPCCHFNFTSFLHKLV